MNLPLILKSAGLRALVVGGGAVAERKVLILLAAGCDVTLIASDIKPALRGLVGTKIKCQAREYQPGDCGKFQLVIAATSDRRVNETISREAREHNIPVNVVDDPDLCSVYFPAIFSEGDLVVAVSTGGKAPFLAAALRDRLKPLLTGWAQWLAVGARFREVVKREVSDETKRRGLLKRFAEAEPTVDMTPPKASDRLDIWLTWLDTISLTRGGK